MGSLLSRTSEAPVEDLEQKADVEEKFVEKEEEEEKEENVEPFDFEEYIKSFTQEEINYETRLIDSYIYNLGLNRNYSQLFCCFKLLDFYIQAEIQNEPDLVRKSFIISDPFDESIAFKATNDIDFRTNRDIFEILSNYSNIEVVTYNESAYNKLANRIFNFISTYPHFFNSNGYDEYMLCADYNSEFDIVSTAEEIKLFLIGVLNIKISIGIGSSPSIARIATSGHVNSIQFVSDSQKELNNFIYPISISKIKGIPKEHMDSLSSANIHDFQQLIEQRGIVSLIIPKRLMQYLISCVLGVVYREESVESIAKEIQFPRNVKDDKVIAELENVSRYVSEKLYRSYVCCQQIDIVFFDVSFQPYSLSNKIKYPTMKRFDIYNVLMKSLSIFKKEKKWKIFKIKMVFYSKLKAKSMSQTCQKSLNKWVVTGEKANEELTLSQRSELSLSLSQESQPRKKSVVAIDSYFNGKLEVVQNPKKLKRAIKSKDIAKSKQKTLFDCKKPR